MDKITPLHSQIDGFKHLVTAAEVAGAIKAVAPHWQIIMPDPQYVCLPHSVWIQIIEGLPTKHLKYSEPSSDCNSFALSAAGLVRYHYWGVNGFGIVYDFSGEHAFNLALTWNAVQKAVDPLFVEPQADLTVKLNSKSAYTGKGEGIVWF